MNNKIICYWVLGESFLSIIESGVLYVNIFFLYFGRSIFKEGRLVFVIN